MPLVLFSLNIISLAFGINGIFLNGLGLAKLSGMYFRIMALSHVVLLLILSFRSSPDTCLVTVISLTVKVVSKGNDVGLSALGR